MKDQTVIVHKHFELGVAPYRYVGLWSAPSPSLAEYNPDAYNNALAGKPSYCHMYCAHCGTGIVNHFIIRDAEGKLFSVGSDCIEKVGDVEKLTQFEVDKRNHRRELSRARANKKREAQRQAFESKLQAQRERNGGLTDWDLAQQNIKNEEALIEKHNAPIVEYFVTALESAGGDFCNDIARHLIGGKLTFTPRCESILLEVTAKHYGGRKNSKAYNEAHELAEEKYEFVKNNIRSK